MASVRAVVTLLLLVFCVVHVTAQKERVLPHRGSSSLEGTRFVVGFMQNEIFEFEGESSLSLFLSSEHNATVVLDFPDGQRVVETLVKHTVRVVPLSAYFEVDVSESRVRKAIFISSNVPITVYAMSARDKTSDTYAAIPIAHLGTEYYSVNRPNDNYELRGADASIDTIPRGGEFMILATESNTDVTITPKCLTAGGNLPGVPFTVRIQASQCFLVRGAPGASGTNDLTGSRIVATKPIALLSGHVRAGIPTTEKTSKDHLVEMLPPVNHWGTEFATAPFAIAEGGDYIRIIASRDSTQIEVMTQFGIRYIQLDKAGDWAERLVTGPAYWKSNRPCMIVQFMASFDNIYRTENSRTDYDPAMVVVPATSQFVMGALFQFPILTDQKVANQPRHYFINVVADSVAVPSLTVNGVLISTLSPGFENRIVPGTSFRWAQVRLQQGVVGVACDTGTFSGVMYGCSLADSYANLFGIRLSPLPKLDLSPPVYNLSVDCGRVSGTVTDVSADTAGIDDVVVQIPPTNNYTYIVSTPLDSIGTTSIDASVRDLWNDAVLVIHTYDKQGNGKEWFYTYDAPRIRVPQNLAVLLLGSEQVCVDGWIVNIDTTAVRVGNIVLVGDSRYALVYTPPVDTLVAAGDSVYVRVCYTPSADTVQRTARVQIQLPCGLRRDFVVRTQTMLSLKTESIDFGPVRIGDTVCGLVPIINDGQSPIAVTALTMATVLPQFSPDTTSLGLPRELLAGDTLWVSVCFVPDAVRTFTREDSVQTVPDFDAVVGYAGRGIRPNVGDVIIDWGKRRIGTRSDTSFTMRNIGEAACILKREGASGDSVSFDVGTFGNPSIALPGDGTSLAMVGFTPDTVALYAASIPLTVDWRYHDTVHIRFMGEGIIPAVETYDINMGAVVVGARRDSVVNLVRSFGSERLTVSNVSVQGADQGAFVLPASLVTVTSISTPVTLTDLVTFIPQRAGYHAITVALEHDAMPGIAKDTSFVTFHGVGIRPDTMGFETALAVEAVLDACVDTSASLRMANTGNTDIVVYDIELYNGDVQIYADTSTPFILFGHTVRDVVVRFTPDRTSDGTLRSIVRYGSNQTDTKNVRFDVRIPAMEITATPLISVSPGASITIETQVRGTAVQDVEVSLSGTYIVPADRLGLNLDPALMSTVDDAIGLGRKVPVLVVRDGFDRYQWTLAGPLHSPFHVSWTVSANSLWKDTRAFDVRSTVNATQCADGDDVATSITNELCAGALRVVRFGARPVATMQVAPNPVEHELDIEVTSSQIAEISLELLTVTGERLVLAEKILLIKGTQHVKFSRSQLAGGLYWLVLKLGNAEAGLPVMFVK